MSELALLRCARRGEPDAIAQLLSRSLAAKGIGVKVAGQGDLLQIRLEGDPIPPACRLLPSLRQGFARLRVEAAIASVRVYGQSVGQDFPDWVEEFSLVDVVIPSPAPPDPLSFHPFPETPGRPPRVAQGDRPGLEPSPSSALPSEIPLSDTTLLVLAHLTPLLAYLSLFWGIFFWGLTFLLPWRGLFPLVLLLIKGRDGGFFKSEAKEALNFQVSMLLYWLGVMILMFLFIGFVLMVPLACFEGICCILAAVKAAEGKSFRFPLTLRLVT